jgi:hypothetical protein
LTLRPGANGAKTMRRFLALVADRYYALTSEIIRRHDPQALVLGDRYQSFYYPEVARASAPYVDVVSTNLNANWNDGTFLRSYLDGLYALAGKPLLVTEFYMAARENRSGCPNSHGMFPRVQTQAQRATAARTTLVELAQLPYVVGADWFQYYDEPPHGRFDGEDYNFGLVDIHGQPYEGLTQAFAASDPTAIHARPTGPPVDATAGVPPAPKEPLAEPEFGSFLGSWDRRRGFVPCSTDAPVGDLYVCWTPGALYLGLYFLDVVEKAYYRDAVVPEEDRAQWRVELGGVRANVRLGAGREATVDNSQVQVTSLPGSDRQVRNVGVLVVPAKALGRKELRAGDRIELRSTLETHARAYRVRWQAGMPLTERQ